VNLAQANIKNLIDAETRDHGQFSLIIVDTSRAYFYGDNENDNAQMTAHARTLRSYVNIHGGPTILVTCHPPKVPNLDNLIPVGGGAFLAEIDGNLVCLKQAAPGSTVIELTWHAKLRGADFPPIPFKIEAGTSERIKDSKGRPIWTVTARPISGQEQESTERVVRRREEDLLAVMLDHEGESLSELAKTMGWFYKTGEPNKAMVQRIMKGFENARLISKGAGSWTLTKAGQKAAHKAKDRQF
jgi:hypothetical protein